MCIPSGPSTISPTKLACGVGADCRAIEEYHILTEATYKTSHYAALHASACNSNALLGVHQHRTLSPSAAASLWMRQDYEASTSRIQPNLTLTGVVFIPLLIM